jgi:flagella basal body P-ring formation protein FlgA
MRKISILSYLFLEHSKHFKKLIHFLTFPMLMVSLSLANAENQLKPNGKNSSKIYAWIVKKRIYTGDILNDNLVEISPVDISIGILRDIKDILLSHKIQLKKFEATQTIVEGQYLTNLSVRKIPDIHRGDSVRIKLISGAIILQAAGISDEIGYVDRKMKVKILRSKRELVGVLRPDGVVEVVL